MIVWRHELMSLFDRIIKLKTATFEKEARRLKKKGKKIGVDVLIYYSQNDDIPAFDINLNAHISIIIARNPKGLISSHHEKLLLIDAECQNHAIAFTGGFDIARGRYDRSLHTPPARYYQIKSMAPNSFVDSDLQAILERIRFNWHDLQLMIRGPSVNILYLHFQQRWIYSLTDSPHQTRNITIKPIIRNCRIKKEMPCFEFKNISVLLERNWNGVFDENYLFDYYMEILQLANEFIYVEHQYPFQNTALTYQMCEILKNKPKLKVLILTNLRTDLPTGIVGQLMDWSHDHMIENLNQIYKTAPERVSIVGLVNQDDSGTIREIYVHSKLIIIDDQIMVTGSTNMDNVSFFYSSELSISLFSPEIARTTRIRLFQEHLEDYSLQFDFDFDTCFQLFNEISFANVKSIQETGSISSRLVPIVPMTDYLYVLSRLSGNQFTRLMKLWMDPGDISKMWDYYTQKAKLFFNTPKL